jgi:hypothetical protein
MKERVRTENQQSRSTYIEDADNVTMQYHQYGGNLIR